MAAARPIILLFDVDGTLITSGGVARRAIVSTLSRRFGGDGCDFPFGGMTDRGIVRRALTSLGQAVTEALIDDVLDDYIHHLEAVLRDVRPGATFRAHDGVNAVLDTVSGQPGVAVGLGTGNIERGARAKLAPVDLNRYFAFGGFGCDAEPRADLIAAGADRGAAALGVPRSDCRVVIIGDTLRDVAAAHAIGGQCLAVATGGDDRDALDDSAAELVVDDLTDRRVVDFLLS